MNKVRFELNVLWWQDDADFAGIHLQHEQIFIQVDNEVWRLRFEPLQSLWKDASDDIRTSS